MLAPYRDHYRWLTDVYESVRPSDIAGRLVWHALGAKTIDLINEHVQVEIPQGAKTIVLDAQTIEDLMLGKRKDIPAGRSRSRSPPGSPATSAIPSSSNSASASTRRARSTLTSSSPAWTSCENSWSWPETPLRPRKPSTRSPRGAGQGCLDRALRSPQVPTTLRSSSTTSSAGSTRSSAVSASRVGSPPSAVTRRSGRPSARRSTSSSRSATTTSSKRPSATSGSATDG